VQRKITEYITENRKDNNANRFDKWVNILLSVPGLPRILINLLRVLDRYGLMPKPLIAASLNENGWLTVTAEKKTYKGCVSVYNQNMDLVFEYNSSHRFVMDACIGNDNRTLAAVTLGQEDSVFVSELVYYDLEDTQPKAHHTIPDALAMDLKEKAGHMLTVTDTCLSVSDRSGSNVGAYDYGGAYLREYDLSGEDFVALVLNRYKTGSVGWIVTVDAQGQEVASLPIHEEVLSISAAGRYLAVLYMDELVLYSPELEEYATISETESVSRVLVTENGAVLMIAAESADLILP